MKQGLKILLAVVVIVAIGLLINYFSTSTQNSAPMGSKNQPTEQVTIKVIQAVFKCDTEKTIDATFYNGKTNSVDVTLSDKRHLTLPQAISASGARYANTDETFVFWNKGDTAFITENGKETFSNCIVTK